VDHPHCPPEVRARELEKRRLREAQLNGMAHAPLPGQRVPRPAAPHRQRYADNNRDDPFG
jgi:hypothetical protein